jgi:hypothetical protein
VSNAEAGESATALDAIFTATIDQTLIANNI